MKVELEGQGLWVEPWESQSFWAGRERGCRESLRSMVGEL